MAVGLAHKIELVACDHLQVMQLDEEAIILDSFDANQDMVVFTHLDHLRMD